MFGVDGCIYIFLSTFAIAPVPLALATLNTITVVEFDLINTRLGSQYKAPDGVGITFSVRLPIGAGGSTAEHLRVL